MYHIVNYHHYSYCLLGFAELDIEVGATRAWANDGRTASNTLEAATENLSL